MSTRFIAVEAVARVIYATHVREKTPSWEATSPGVRFFVLAQARNAAIEVVRQYKAAGMDAEVQSEDT